MIRRMVNRRSPRSPGKRPRRLPPTPSERDYEYLITALNEAGELLPVLSALLPEPSGRPQTGTIGRHAPESSEPWQDEAAHAYWGIWYGIRTLANEMRRAAGLQPDTYGPDRTAAALAAVAAMASTVPPDMLAEARRRVEGWVQQARRIRDIDEVETWVPVPRVPDRPLPLCPYCKTLGLRMNRARLEVRCSFPGCTDFDGNPTRARMTYGRMSGEGQLVFDDKTVVAYREEAPLRTAETGGSDDRATPAEEHDPRG